MRLSLKQVCLQSAFTYIINMANPLFEHVLCRFIPAPTTSWLSKEAEDILAEASPCTDMPIGLSLLT